MSPSLPAVFLGCPLGTEAADALVHWQTQLQDNLAAGPASQAVRWIARPSLHLTLHYLGPLRSAQIRSLQSHLGQILDYQAAMPLQLGSPGIIPPAARPRGIWIELVDVQDQLCLLHGALHDMLRTLNLESRSARLRPHITIGRLPRSIQHSQRHAIIQTVRIAQSTQHGSVCSGTLDRIHLYESHRQPGGNTYHPRLTWSLLPTTA